MEPPGVHQHGDGNGEASVTDGGVRATAGEARVQVTLFDAEGEDRDLDVREVDAAALGEHQLLWIDLVGTPDADVAAVLTFVRASWGNRASPVSELEVAQQRSSARP